MGKTRPAKRQLVFVLLLQLPAFCFSQIEQQWVARYNGPANSSDIAADIAVDAAGNVYVTGGSIASGSNFDFLTIKYDNKGTVQWKRRYKGPEDGSEQANSIAVDAAGNVYVTGQSESTKGYLDYATIKYDAAGNELWARRYDGPGNATDIPFAISVTASGNVYVTGSSYGDKGNTDYATIKYSSTGTLQWVARYDGPAKEFDGANALVVDKNENAYVTGYSQGVGSAEDYATVKYNANGVQQWVARYNGPANSLDQAFALALDGVGNVYVTGQSFDAVTGSAYATIKYNAAGVQQWAKRYHAGIGSDVARAVAVDADGNAYVTGQSNTSNFDEGDDYTTVKYTTGGVQQWVATYDGPDQASDQAYAIVLDGASNVYVTGTSSNVVDFFVEGDYATVKYNSQGTQQWVARYAGPGNSTDIATAIALDSAGGVYITGLSNGGTTEFDYATIKYSAKLSCGEGADKVLVCHKGKTLCISTHAVAAHLKHGDVVGSCAQVNSNAGFKIDVSEQQTATRNGFGLSHYPNPVVAYTKIQYELPSDGKVLLALYNSVGKEVAVLVNADKRAGRHHIDLDASALSTGLYYYRVVVRTKKNVFTQTKKMVVLR